MTGDSTQQRVSDVASLTAFLDDLERRLEAIDVAYNECLWGRYTGQEAGDINELEAQRAAILLDEAAFVVVREWLSRDEVLPSTLLRRLTVLHRQFLGARVESRPEVYELRNRLEEAHIGFQPVIGRKKVSRAELLDIRRRDRDRVRRREAWLALAPLGDDIQADVRELIVRRNQLARELGYTNYVELGLALVGLERTQVLELFLELEESADEPYRRLLSQGANQLGLDELAPWDVTFVVEALAALPDEYFPREQLIPKLMGLAASLGFPDDPDIRIEFVDIPFGGLCFGVRVPDDVRILANPRDGQHYYAVLFHEFGHALHARYTDQPTFALKHDPGPFNEGMACTLERFVADPGWLRDNTDLAEGKIQHFRLAWVWRKAYWLRRMIAESVFEFRAYADPAQDLNALWREVNGGFLLVPFDEAPGWAASAIYTTHPVYMQNYVVAEVIAAQIYSFMRRKFRRLLHNADVGRFLINCCYAPGASLEWMDKLHDATGVSLSARALIKELAAGV